MDVRELSKLSGARPASARRQLEALREKLAAARGKPLIMGILNVTPDSFSDGGSFAAPEAALARARQMTAEGAAIIDVGGESTRPGAGPVTTEEEITRVLPVIGDLVERGLGPVSIDTYKTDVARLCAAAGAVMINDVTGLSDPGIAAAAAETQSLLVITYHRGEASSAIDFLADMHAFCARALAKAEAAGVPRADLVLDPGIGFAKTAEQNHLALARLDVLLEFGLPVLVGASRKSFIGKLTGAPAGDRLGGTLAAHLAAMHGGASILRAHDVDAHRQALMVADAIGRAG